MADFSNIPTGLKITSQIPLNVKEYCLNESTLSYLGVDDNLAYTYHKGITILCIEQNTIWQWREVLPGEENTGLIPVDFTYPSDLEDVYGINYSGKTYNFFEIDLTGPQGPQGIQGPVGPQGPQGEPGEGSNISIENSATTVVNGDGVITPYSVEVVNLQKEVSVANYTLQASDHLHTIFLAPPPDTIMTITIPETGLPNNFVVGFYHVTPPGKYAIFFKVENGLTQKLRVPSGFMATMNTNGNFSCMIERRLATKEYMLNGDLIAL